jgi:drug/metabolite transporter (DMT)-like permease
MTQRNKALLAILTCVLFWGISFVSIKIAVAVFPPMTLGAFRFALAVVFLLIITYGPGAKTRAEKLRLRDLPWLIGAGLVGDTLYFFCENNGVALVSASEASIIIGAIPVLTMAAEWLAGNLPAAVPVRISGRRWLGALISMVGVWLVARVSITAASGNALGYLYMAGAALSWVAYCFLTRPLFARCSQLYITFWQSLFGFIGFVPFAALEYPRWGRPDLPVLGHILFLGICCSALGYWFYIISMDVLGVPLSSVFINFVPMVTVIAGFFLLGERLTPLQWGGAVLVLSGVTLAMIEKGDKRRNGGA